MARVSCVQRESSDCSKMFNMAASRYIFQNKSVFKFKSMTVYTVIGLNEKWNVPELRDRTIDNKRSGLGNVGDVVALRPNFPHSANFRLRSTAQGHWSLKNTRHRCRLDALSRCSWDQVRDIKTGRKKWCSKWCISTTRCESCRRWIRHQHVTCAYMLTRL